MTLSKNNEIITILENNNTTAQILKKYATYNHPDIRRVVASRINCPTTLHWYLKDTYVAVKMAVASNSSTGLKTLYILAQQDNIWIQRNLLQNPKVQKNTTILEYLQDQSIFKEIRVFAEQLLSDLKI